MSDTPLSPVDAVVPPIGGTGDGPGLGGPSGGGGGLRKRSNLKLLNLLDGVTYSSALGGALLMLVMLGILAVTVFRGALPSMKVFGLSFLVTAVWNPVTAKFGAMPLIYGTLASALLSILISVPISIGSALFLVKLAPKMKIPIPAFGAAAAGGNRFTFYSPRNLVTFVSFLIELLAAIPSIAYGLWGMAVMAPFMQSHVQPWLGATLGHVPGIGRFFDNDVGKGTGSNILTAAVVLSIMVTPIITSIVRDVLAVAPVELEQGALGLGATWWQATKLVLNFSKMGIFGAVILGFARAIGETMAVTMVIGNTIDQAHPVFSSFLAPGQTISSALANQFAEADTDELRQALIYSALVLLVITTLINGIARLMVMRVTAPKKR